MEKLLKYDISRKTKRSVFTRKNISPILPKPKTVLNKRPFAVTPTNVKTPPISFPEKKRKKTRIRKKKQLEWDDLEDVHSSLIFEDKNQSSVKTRQQTKIMSNKLK